MYADNLQWWRCRKFYVTVLASIVSPLKLYQVYTLLPTHGRGGRALPQSLLLNHAVDTTFVLVKQRMYLSSRWHARTHALAAVDAHVTDAVVALLGCRAVGRGATLAPDVRQQVGACLLQAAEEAAGDLGPHHSCTNGGACQGACVSTHAFAQSMMHSCRAVVLAIKSMQQARPAVSSDFFPGCCKLCIMSPSQRCTCHHMLACMFQSVMAQACKSHRCLTAACGPSCLNHAYCWREALFRAAQRGPHLPHLQIPWCSLL